MLIARWDLLNRLKSICKQSECPSVSHSAAGVDQAAENLLRNALLNVKLVMNNFGTFCLELKSIWS